MSNSHLLNRTSTKCRHAIKSIGWLIGSLILTTLSSASFAYHEEERLREKALWEKAAELGSVVLITAAREDGMWLQEPGSYQECYRRENLTAHGFNSAKRYYKTLHGQGIHEAMVYSSTDCATLETAELLQLGAVHPLPLLNRINNGEGLPVELLSGTLKRWIEAHPTNHLLVLMTYQDVVKELIGLTPDPYDMVVISRDDKRQLTLEGKIPLIKPWGEKTDKQLKEEEDLRIKPHLLR
ncbi:MAG: hypothetical protein ACPGYX_09190 [Oceanobacter sp.]